MAYQNYSQTDPRWKNQRIGTNNSINLGMAGCYVTAFANVSEHFGKDVTPAQLDDLFTDRRLYVGDDDPANGIYLCTDDMLEKVYPDIKFSGVYHCEGIPCDLTVFNEFNNYEHEAIIELDASYDPGIQTHFCRFYDYDPTTGRVRIVDSQDGQIVSVERYGNPAEVILKVVKYTGPSLFTPTPEPMVPAPTVPTAVPVAPLVDSLSRPTAPTPKPQEPSPEPATTDPEPKPSILPSRDSAAGRALATTRQALIGIGGLVAGLLAFIQDPIYHTLIAHYAPWLVTVPPLLSGLVTWIENLKREDVENY